MYYRNRMYHAASGRFVSREPIVYAAGDVNLYRYVLNSPLMYVDPAGTAVFLLKPIMPLRPLPAKPLPPIFQPRPPVLQPRPLPPTLGPRPQYPVMPNWPHHHYPPLPKPFEKPAPFDPQGPQVPGDGMQRPGDCSDAEHDALYDKVKAKCKPGIPSCDRYTGYGSGWDCSGFERAAKAWDECYKARKELMDRCYKGGDKGHIDRANWAKYHRDTCWYKYHYWGCGCKKQPYFFPPGTEWA